MLSAFSSNFENVLKTVHNVVANLEIDSEITGNILTLKLLINMKKI